jgi:uncharacterized tellurite resistance protein B-like protein
MIETILRRLSGQDSRAPLATDDARLALAALLVRVARTDGLYAAEEVERIDRILARHFALSPFEATAMRAQAERLEQSAPDTVRFTRVLKDAVELEDRVALAEALWSVALVDQTRDADEDALIRLVTNLLGLSDRDSALARQRASRA